MVNEVNKLLNGFVGTYSEGRSRGIYSFSIDEKTGNLSEVSLFAEVENSKYLAMNDEFLFTLCSENGKGGVAIYDFQGNCVEKLLFEEVISCYLLLDGNFLYCSNYHLGTVTKLEFSSGKLQVLKKVFFAEKAGAHQVIPYKNTIFVPCLHLDKIFILGKDLEVQGEVLFPKGSGCRHGVVSLDEKYLYILGELSNKIHCISLNSKEIVAEISIIPALSTSNEGGAALRMSEDGTRLLASTRDAENLVTIVKIKGETMEMELISDSGGKHPRDILNILGDRYVLVANRDSDTLDVLDYKNNMKKTSTIVIPEGVSIIMKGNESK